MHLRELLRHRRLGGRRRLVVDELERAELLTPVERAAAQLVDLRLQPVHRRDRRVELVLLGPLVELGVQRAQVVERQCSAVGRLFGEKLNEWVRTRVLRSERHDAAAQFLRERVADGCYPLRRGLHLGLDGAGGSVGGLDSAGRGAGSRRRGSHWHAVRAAAGGDASCAEVAR